MNYSGAAVAFLLIFFVIDGILKILKKVSITKKIQKQDLAAEKNTEIELCLYPNSKPIICGELGMSIQWNRDLNAIYILSYKNPFQLEILVTEDLKGWRKPQIDTDNWYILQLYQHHTTESLRVQCRSSV